MRTHKHVYFLDESKQSFVGKNTPLVGAKIFLDPEFLIWDSPTYSFSNMQTPFTVRVIHKPLRGFTVFLPHIFWEHRSGFFRTYYEVTTYRS